MGNKQKNMGHNEERIFDREPPSEWSDLLRNTAEIAYFQVRFRTGGRGAGYRDLGSMRRFKPQIDVLDENGNEIDGVGEIAEEAWQTAQSHWEEKLQEGGRAAQYVLAVFDSERQELDCTRAFVVRAGSDDVLESDADSALHRQNKQQIAFIEQLVKQNERLMSSTISVIERCADLIGKLPQQPESNDAQHYAAAAWKVQRSREGGETVRELIRTFGPMLQEEIKRRTGTTVPVDVLVELGSLGAPAELIACVVAGDRRAARGFEGFDQPTAPLFHAWLNQDCAGDQ